MIQPCIHAQHCMLLSFSRLRRTETAQTSLEVQRHTEPSSRYFTIVTFWLQEFVNKTSEVCAVLVMHECEAARLCGRNELAMLRLASECLHLRQVR